MRATLCLEAEFQGVLLWAEVFLDQGFETIVGELHLAIAGDRKIEAELIVALAKWQLAQTVLKRTTLAAGMGSAAWLLAVISRASAARKRLSNLAMMYPDQCDTGHAEHQHQVLPLPLAAVDLAVDAR